MINLLPRDVKESVIYGRRNTVLLRWVSAICVVIIGIFAISLFGQFYISQNKKSIQQTAAQTDKRIESENLESYKKDLTSLTNDMKTVIQILRKQLLFSKLFPQIGKTLPSGSFLGTVTINSTDSSLDLTILSKDEATANQAFVNVKDSNNQIFGKTDLISIICTEPTKAYPCTAQVKAVLNIDLSKRIAALLPEGSKFESLTAKSSPNQYIVTVSVKKTADAYKFDMSKITSANKLITSAKPGSVECKTEEQIRREKPEYECTMKLNVTVNPDASFYFLETTSFTGDK